MSYGAEPTPMWAQAATFVDRIPRGKKPADLPVMLPTKYEFVKLERSKKHCLISVNIPRQSRGL